MFIVNHRPIFFWITGLLLVGAIAAIAIFGLPLSIDFTGGSLVEVSYTDARPELATLKQNISALSLGETSILESGTNAVTLRTRALTPNEHVAVLAALAPASTTLTENQFSSVGPSLGNELSRKAVWALIAVIFAIVLYIAWAFRRVSRPVPSWGYGLTAVFMLVIDIIVPTGFYAIWCHYTGAQVDTLFVVALLALLGYCVNDVIVIFDRIRENLARNEKVGLKEPFEEVVGHSITATLGRSINTALTVVIALIALIFFGSEITRNFSLVMLVGVLAGTFSSICRSAPLLIPIAHWFDKKA